MTCRTGTLEILLFSHKYDVRVQKRAAFDQLLEIQGQQHDMRHFDLPGGRLCLFQYAQALLLEALVVEHAGVVELLVQPNARVLVGVVYAQAGQHLPV